MIFNIPDRKHGNYNKKCMVMVYTRPIVQTKGKHHELIIFYIQRMGSNFYFYEYTSVIDYLYKKNINLDYSEYSNTPDQTSEENYKGNLDKLKSKLTTSGPIMRIIKIKKDAEEGIFTGKHSDENMEDAYMTKYKLNNFGN